MENKSNFWSHYLDIITLKIMDVFSYINFIYIYMYIYSAKHNIVSLFPKAFNVK